MKKRLLIGAMAIIAMLTIAISIQPLNKDKKVAEKVYHLTRCGYTSWESAESGAAARMAGIIGNPLYTNFQYRITGGSAETGYCYDITYQNAWWWPS